MKELPFADAESQSERGSKKIAGKEHGVSVHLNNLLSEVWYGTLLQVFALDAYFRRL